MRQQRRQFVLSFAALGLRVVEALPQLANHLLALKRQSPPLRQFTRSTTVDRTVLRTRIRSCTSTVRRTGPRVHPMQLCRIDLVAAVDTTHGRNAATFDRLGDGRLALAAGARGFPQGVHRHPPQTGRPLLCTVWGNRAGERVDCLHAAAGENGAIETTPLTQRA